MADLGTLEYHGLVGLAYSEAEIGIAGVDYGALEYHGLIGLAYAVESAGTVHAGAAALSGAGDLTADGEVIHAIWEGAAALAGAGDLVADGEVIHAIWEGAAALAGAGDLVADGDVIHAIWEGAAALSGIGDLIADGSVIHAIWEGAAALSGVGSLVADGYVPVFGGTVTATWPFATTAEGWVGSGTNWTMVYRSGEGNPAGSLRAGIFGANRANAGAWTVTGTWADLFGIPPGATVLQVRVYRIDWRCQSYAYIDELRVSSGPGANVNGLQYLGSSNLALWAGAQPTGITSWADPGPGVNQDVPIADQPATTSVSYRINVWGDTQNNASADGRLQFDNVTIEITYTTGTTHAGAASLSGVGSLVADGTTVHAVWMGAASLLGIGTLTADGIAFIAPPARIARARIMPSASTAEISGLAAAGRIVPTPSTGRWPDD